MNKFLITIFVSEKAQQQLLLFASLYSCLAQRAYPHKLLRVFWLRQLFNQITKWARSRSYTLLHARKLCPASIKAIKHLPTSLLIHVTCQFNQSYGFFLYSALSSL